MTRAASITFVTVSYRGAEDTARLLRSLEALDGRQRLRLVVVDTGGDASTRDQIGRLAAGAQVRTAVLHVPDNLYYWGGAAHGLTWAREEGPSDWWVVCNNDVEFSARDFLTRLQEKDPGRYPVVGPSIRSSLTGAEQNPLASEPWGPIGLMKWRLLDSSLLAARSVSSLRRLRKRLGVGRASRTAADSVDERRIYAPHGAAIVFSQAFFDAGGFLDLSVPMFAEELSLAETARRLGLSITMCPDLRVVHHEHGSLGGRRTKQQHRWAREAHRYLRSAYFGPHPEDLDEIRSRSRVETLERVET